MVTLAHSSRPPCVIVSLCNQLKKEMAASCHIYLREETAFTESFWKEWPDEISGVAVLLRPGEKRYLQSSASYQAKYVL